VKRVELSVYRPWIFLKLENAKQDGDGSAEFSA
jgi:hypothetical protein